MPKIPDPTTPVNDPTTPNPNPAPLSTGDLRNEALAAWALAEAVNDALEALPPGTIDGRILMLGALCEEKCGAVFSGTEEFAAKPR